MSPVSMCRRCVCTVQHSTVPPNQHPEANQYLIVYLRVLLHHLVMSPLSSHLLSSLLFYSLPSLLIYSLPSLLIYSLPFSSHLFSPFSSHLFSPFYSLLFSFILLHSLSFLFSSSQGFSLNIVLFLAVVFFFLGRYLKAT
jgi:hypothetical protein